MGGQVGGQCVCACVRGWGAKYVSRGARAGHVHYAPLLPPPCVECGVHLACLANNPVSNTHAFRGIDPPLAPPAHTC